jgi:carbon monoxide dehydrogenase subunit G
MPKIQIDHECPHSVDDTVSKLKTFFESEGELKRIDPSIKASFDSSGRGQIQGSQFKADVAVESNGNGSLVQVIVDLPFLLSPFKGKIQETVQRKLAKYLA